MTEERRYNDLLLSFPEDDPGDGGDLRDGYYDCPTCGEPFFGDDWESTTAGDGWGASVMYVCPSCGDQSVTVLY